MVVAACGNGQGRDVAVPPRDARPATVVSVYLDALDAHDIETARGLLTAQHARDVEAAQDSWFSNVESITNVRVRSPTHRVASPSGYPQRVTVPVSFELKQHHEESMPDGRTEWSYELVKTGSAGRWRIATEGMG
ncbi:MAG: hypothetical protein ACTHOK_08605 [Nocardioidaceae bacterium]